MRILGLVIMRAKRYDEHNAAVDLELEELKVKVGSLKFDKKVLKEWLCHWREVSKNSDECISNLQKQLKDAEIHIEQLSEMNAGLWEMKGVSVDAERE